jgi:hypothetical protein
VKESPPSWNSPEEDQSDAEKNQLPMSRQERVQMPIGQKTGERGQNAPPEEHLHNPERIRLREPIEQFDPYARILRML